MFHVFLPTSVHKGAGGEMRRRKGSRDEEEDICQERANEVNPARDRVIPRQKNGKTHRTAVKKFTSHCRTRHPDLTSDVLSDSLDLI